MKNIWYSTLLNNGSCFKCTVYGRIKKIYFHTSWLLECFINRTDHFMDQTHNVQKTNLSHMLCWKWDIIHLCMISKDITGFMRVHACWYSKSVSVCVCVFMFKPILPAAPSSPSDRAVDSTACVDVHVYCDCMWVSECVFSYVCVWSLALLKRVEDGRSSGTAQLGERVWDGRQGGWPDLVLLFLKSPAGGDQHTHLSYALTQREREREADKFLK